MQSPSVPFKMPRLSRRGASLRENDYVMKSLRYEGCGIGIVPIYYAKECQRDSEMELEISFKGSFYPRYLDNASGVSLEVFRSARYGESGLESSAT